MSYRTKADAIVSRFQDSRFYRLNVESTTNSISVDAQRLAAAESVTVTVAEDRVEAGTQLIRSLKPHLRPQATVQLLLAGLGESLLAGGLDQLAWALQSFGYSIIDTVMGANSILVGLRNSPTLSTEELTVWLCRDGTEISLIHPEPDDLLRRYPLISRRFYEQDLLEYMASRSSGGVFLDIGANVGNHSVFMAKFAGATVLAFEPAPANYACLEANIRENALSADITAYPMALGASAGAGGIVAPQSHNSGAFQFRIGTGDIPLQPLDAAFPPLDRLDVVKIDVEGMEEDVLCGGLETLRRFRPELYVEILDPARLSVIESRLAPLGYRKIQCHTGNPTWEFRV